VISEELVEGMNLEQVGKVSLQSVAEEAIPAKLVKVDVRLCASSNDTDEEIRSNEIYDYTICDITMCVYSEDGK